MQKKYIQKLKHILVCGTATLCLLLTCVSLRAQLGIFTVGDEKGLGDRLDNPTTNIIKLQKGSHIKLTRDLPAPKNIIGIEGNIEKDGKKGKKHEQDKIGGKKYPGNTPIAEQFLHPVKRLLNGSHNHKAQSGHHYFASNPQWSNG